MEIERTLTARFGSAKHPDRSRVHPQPVTVPDAVVAAVGKVTEALEIVENARGFLYAFHRLCGEADLALQDAVDELRASGAGVLADDLDEVLVGRDIVDGRWSFQLVEDYDERYWRVFRAAEQHARETLGVAPPHVREAGMKHREQQRDR